jgi:predicted amidohydrolase YtcJ
LRAYEETKVSNLTADWILFNGKIFTIDSKDSIAEAIAVRESKILKVGTTEDILKLRGPQTKDVNLEGKMVTPGLIDCHNHTAAYGFSFLRQNLNYSKVHSIEDLQQSVKEKTEKLPPGTWIWDIGWDGNISSLTENRFPNRSDLDLVSPEHPVALAIKTGEYVVKIAVG